MIGATSRPMVGVPRTTQQRIAPSTRSVMRTDAHLTLALATRSLTKARASAIRNRHPTNPSGRCEPLYKTQAESRIPRIV